MFRKRTLIAAAAAFAMTAPAGAQLGVDLDGVGVDAGVDVDARAEFRTGDPYVYRGYNSGRWYPYERPRRAHRYYDAYGGYDCYRAFQYTWEDGYRTRYESRWCFDDDGRRYEVDGTRVAVRID